MTAKIQRNSGEHFSRKLKISSPRNQYRRNFPEDFNFLKSFGRYEDFLHQYYLFLSIFWIF